MKTLRLVLGDQLSRSLSALRNVEISQDVVLMVEAHDEATYVRHHPQKIVLVLSAMRHFAESLRAEGLRVDYVRLDDAGHFGSFTGELGRALSRHPVDRIVVTEPRVLTGLNEAALVVGSGGSTTACGSCWQSASLSFQPWSEIVCGRLPCGHRPLP